MPDFDPKTFNSVKKYPLENIKSLPDNLILGSDINKIAIQIAKENLMLIPNGEKVNLKVADFSKLTIITNPPYGKKLGKKVK